jgi:hypothetical protein
MYAVWSRLPVKEMANGLGVYFETPLMSDERLYEYAKANNLLLYYQFDGFGIFSDVADNQSVLEAKLRGLCTLMQQISIEKFNVPIVVKQEMCG